MEGNTKNRDIEVLRAVAICSVIANHWVPHFLGRFGSAGQLFETHTALWSGVDLFFCISGYVIARSTLKAATADASLWAFTVPFWIRRIFRLWPSAWLWAVIPVVLSVVWNRSGGFGAPGPAALDALMAVLNVENFHYFHCLRTDSCGSLSVYWSLSLEEQFYWVFPILLLLLRRRALIWGLAALAAAQIILPRPNSFASTDPSLLWLVRTDGIALGILLALLEQPGTGAMASYILRTPLRARLLTIVLLGILATAAAPSFALSRATGILALASAGLVWIARFDRALIFPVTRLEPVVLWLGSRSYSLYLTHAVAGRTAAEIRDRIVLAAPHINPRLTVVLGLLFTFGLAYGFSELNFRLLESPLRAAGRRLSQSLARGASPKDAPVPA